MKIFLATVFISVLFWVYGNYTEQSVMYSPIAGTINKVEAREVDPAKMKIQIISEELYEKYKTNYPVIYAIVSAYGPTEGVRAVHVAFCESSHDPGKTNASGSSAKGLFQIIDGTWIGYHCSGSPLNAADNIACSYKLYQADGWDSTATWSSSKGCWSK